MHWADSLEKIDAGKDWGQEEKEVTEDEMDGITDSVEKIDAGKDWGQEEKEATEDEMAGWQHQLNGNECEQTPGDSEGQGSLACCRS